MRSTKGTEAVMIRELVRIPFGVVGGGSDSTFQNADNPRFHPRLSRNRDAVEIRDGGSDPAGDAAQAGRDRRARKVCCLFSIALVFC